jgi:hypothetical protein
MPDMPMTDNNERSDIDIVSGVLKIIINAKQRPAPDSDII